MPNDALAGLHILVLGGSTGIGFGTSQYLARSGARLTVGARWITGQNSSIDGGSRCAAAAAARRS